ncbi:PepSY domain-containing protein [Alteromonas sp. NFXS44]|uniref:PepSY-associated TM helix domain-containing protein n=1 Tax=Alteromonas sp. NFXS44 TaxID=2818435 RepID=UPI0032E02A81
MGINWRKVHRRIHLWLGLSVGILFTVIALSGAILVFYNELDSALNLPASQSQHAATSPDYDTALKTLRAAYPDKNRSWRFEVTNDAGVIPARYYNPKETAGEDFAPMMVWLTADGTTVLRRDFWGQYFVTWIYNLHFRLLLGSTGGIIVGYLGLACTYLLISGLIAWWPKRGQWARQLRFKRKANKIGLLYDWHKTLGLFSAIPLLLLCVTGVMLALPKESRFVLEPVFGQSQFANFASENATSAPPVISPAQALAIAKQVLPASKGAWIETPDAGGSRAHYRIRLQVSGDPSRRFPHSYVYIDGVSGKVLEVFDYQIQGATNTIMNWLHPLHDGTYFTLAGRILWLLTGMLTLGLFVLGIWRWMLRTRHLSTKTSPATDSAPRGF